jgi:hypothetical protein
MAEHDVTIRGGGMQEWVEVCCATCGFNETANSEYEQSLLREHDKRAESA